MKTQLKQRIVAFILFTLPIIVAVASAAPVVPYR